jgi:ElaB/YqjD/DUF883 family membrane-anchored ribosome-binding protein
MLARAARFNLYKSTLVARKAPVSIASYSTLGDKAKKVGDKIDETLQKGKEVLNGAAADVNEKAEETKQAFNEATANAGEKAEEAKQAFNETKADANQKAHETKEHAKDKVNEAADEVKKNTQ